MSEENGCITRLSKHNLKVSGVNISIGTEWVSISTPAPTECRIPFWIMNFQFTKMQKQHNSLTLSLSKTKISQTSAIWEVSNKEFFPSRIVKIRLQAVMKSVFKIYPCPQADRLVSTGRGLAWQGSEDTVCEFPALAYFFMTFPCCDAMQTAAGMTVRRNMRWLFLFFFSLSPVGQQHHDQHHDYSPSCHCCYSPHSTYIWLLL